MFYQIVRAFLLVIVKMLYRIKIHGKENIPGRKPFIICSNHLSWWDPVVIGTTVPGSYRIHFMAKKELFNNFIFSYLLRKACAFPLNRKDADYAAIRKAYQLLENRQVLGLFPEGSRSKNGTLQKPYNGAALIAVRSGVPVLPVAIAGPYRLFRPLHVFIGPPFALPPLNYNHKEEKKAQLEEMSRLIMGQIRSLLPEYKAN